LERVVDVLMVALMLLSLPLPLAAPVVSWPPPLLVTTPVSVVMPFPVAGPEMAVAAARPEASTCCVLEAMASPVDALAVADVLPAAAPVLMVTPPTMALAEPTDPLPEPA